MSLKAVYRIKDYHTGEVVYQFNGANEVPNGALNILASGGQVEESKDVWVDRVEGGILRTMYAFTGQYIPVYTHDWLTNIIERQGENGTFEIYHEGGLSYPGGRPTDKDYKASTNTLKPPARTKPEEPGKPEEPEEPGKPEEPEEPGKPEEPEVPPAEVFDEYDLIEAMGDEAPSIEVARAAMRAATDLIDTYTRGAAYRRIRLPRLGVNAVVHSVAARIAANPGFISRRDQAGNFSRSLGAGFTGFTLTEKTALNSYRRTAR